MDARFDEREETAEVGGGPGARWRDDLGMAATFLTRLPWPLAVTHDRKLMAAAWAFPLVGAGVGAIGALVLGAALGLGLPPVAAALIAVAAAVLTTGGLHEDGLADCADGFGGGRDAEAKRRIMRDSRIGSYGVLALILLVGLKVVAVAGLAAIAPELAAASMIAAHALARAAMPALARTAPAATDGLARMAGRPTRLAVLWAAGIGAALAVALAPGGTGVVATLLAGGVAWGVGRLALRQIGGITGDVLGAAGQLAETAALLAILAAVG